MHLDLDDGGISRVLYSVGQRELAFMTLLKETIQPGMVCIDLGANIGYTTLFMLDQVGSQGYVYAIEPDLHNDIKRFNCCHLTFDDGHISFYNNAYPIIKDYKIPASLYVSPEIVQNKELYWFQNF